MYLNMLKMLSYVYQKIAIITHHPFQTKKPFSMMVPVLCAEF